MRLHDYLDFRRAERPAAEFAVQGERRISYADALLAAANRIANALIDAGLRPGDRVASWPRTASSSSALLRRGQGGRGAGAAQLPAGAAEWAFIVNDAGARLLIARGEYVAAIDAVRGELTSVGNFLRSARRAAGWEAYDAWLAAQPATPPARDIDAEARRLPDVHQRDDRPAEGRRAQHRAVCQRRADRAALAIRPASAT